VYCDLKPANLCFQTSDADTAVMIDLESVMLLSEAIQNPGDVRHTPHYSMELSLPSILPDFKIDFICLATSLFEIITGSDVWPSNGLPGLKSLAESKDGLPYRVIAQCLSSNPNAKVIFDSALNLLTQTEKSRWQKIWPSKKVQQD